MTKGVPEMKRVCWNEKDVLGVIKDLPGMTRAANPYPLMRMRARKQGYNADKEPEIMEFTRIHIYG